jgi:hypothetical protein
MPRSADVFFASETVAGSSRSVQAKAIIARVNWLRVSALLANTGFWVAFLVIVRRLAIRSG